MVFDPTQYNINEETAKAMATDSLVEGWFKWRVLTASLVESQTGGRAVLMRLQALDGNTDEPIPGATENFRLPIPLSNHDVPEYKVRPWEYTRYNQFVLSTLGNNISPMPVRKAKSWFVGETQIAPDEVPAATAKHKHDLTKLAVELAGEPRQLVGLEFIGNRKISGEYVNIYAASELPGNAAFVSADNAMVTTEFTAAEVEEALTEKKGKATTKAAR